ncbi:membrane protein [Brachybacterium phenoliresistens]|uniref:Membrane protein n=1 Tax=Brachybacterium phenoliresistens TaxID=396014 RepID=Z9JP96_9MICO|nr:phosphatase PAP2 family protein [Brachybacterium phenoliresistens]EWS80245.1 membrane protein [Brachybacterium phenoliresistens]
MSALLAAVVCGLGTWQLVRFAVGTARGQRLDQLILSAAQADGSFVAQLVFPAISTVTVPVIIAILLAAGVLCIARRRVGLLAQIAAMVIGANLTTQVVKHLLVPRDVLAEGIEVTPNSFPSGHTTLAMAAAVAIVLAVPDRLRSLAAVLAAGWAVGAGVGTMAEGWHRPSDVAGAVLVVGAWTFLMLALDAAAAAAGGPAAPARPRAREGAPARRSGAAGAVLLIAVAIVAVAGALLAGAAIPTPLQLEDIAHQRTAYAASILAILAGTSALVGTVLVLRVDHTSR